MEENLAVAEWERADQAWQDALSKLATARIRTANGAVIAGPAGDFEYRPPGRRDRRREEKLQEEEAGGRIGRERAGEALAKARQRHRRAASRRGRPPPSKSRVGSSEQAHPSWHRRAACAAPGVTADFFSEKVADVETARAVCRGCPVAPQCRYYGADKTYGVWGGVAAAERAEGTTQGGLTAGL